MLEGIKRYRDLVAVSICLLIPAVILYAQSRDDAEAGPVLRGLVTLTAPLQSAMAWVVTGVSDRWEAHWQNASSLEDARRTRMDMARLRAQVARLDEIERENNRLRALLNAAPTPTEGQVQMASVVAVGASPAYRTVRVDQGRNAGLRRGMAVVNEDGAVGTVLRTSGGYADVLLISDRQSAVDVMVARTGARGLLRGAGAEGQVLLRVEGLDRTADLQPGDQVVATGLGARFPRGTLVGHVVASQMPEGELTQTADVKPVVSFERLRNVLVVVTPEGRRSAAAKAPPNPQTDTPAEDAGAPQEATRQPQRRPAPEPAPSPKRSAPAADASVNAQTDADAGPARAARTSKPARLQAPDAGTAPPAAKVQTSTADGGRARQPKAVPPRSADGGRAAATPRAVPAADGGRTPARSRKTAPAAAPAPLVVPSQPATGTPP